MFWAAWVPWCRRKRGDGTPYASSCVGKDSGSLAERLVARGCGSGGRRGQARPGPLQRERGGDSGSTQRLRPHARPSRPAGSRAASAHGSARCVYAVCGARAVKPAGPADSGAAAGTAVSAVTTPHTHAHACTLTPHTHCPGKLPRNPTCRSLRVLGSGQRTAVVRPG